MLAHYCDGFSGIKTGHTGSYQLLSVTMMRLCLGSTNLHMVEEVLRVG